MRDEDLRMLLQPRSCNQRRVGSRWGLERDKQLGRAWIVKVKDLFVVKSAQRWVRNGLGNSRVDPLSQSSKRPLTT